ncbi:MAG: divergent polysaccharide deacetylase family protein [Thermovirgaceae bacterium]|nr:divergent polysaccharide deacetylase family protein [Synergistales bacterium]HRS48122.1 divergent polysaccharide deacetylase family protein [Thermovirgaceae bacterium]HRU91232.1 divergent polysaccharide deacetylase family protein [Thermovirgaceae bacterium]
MGRRKKAVKGLLFIVLCALVFPGAARCYGGFVQPPAVAVIVDDLGFSLDAAKRLASIPIPMTWAIIPYQRFSQATARMAKDHGIPFLVHMPMEAKGSPGNRKTLVRAGMDPEAVRVAVRNALWSLPGAVGLNNHQGSRATEDPRAMGGVMLELKAEGLFFVDSRTSGRSVAYHVAMEKGIPAASNRFFLDHYDEESFLREQFRKAFAWARKNGGAVAICHARPGTLDFLPKLLEMTPEDVEFVTVPDYLARKSMGGWEE